MADYSDYYYDSEDGLRLYARDYACRDASQSQPATVLCMHGLTRNSADFADLALHLSAHYRVVSVDNRGRGRSEYDSNSARYTPTTYVQDMFTLLTKLDVDEVILCGTSMGGLMSFMMAAMQPSRIRAMIINDIGPVVAKEGLERLKGYVGKSSPVSSWQDAIAQAKATNSIAFPDFSDAEWEDFTRGIYREENGVPVLAYDPSIAQPMADQESTALSPDLWLLFEAITAVPMLLLRGVTSDILAAETVREMREKHPAMQFVEVPNRGHAPTLNEPVSRAAIDAFLVEV
ncbi:MAG: alpha/beta hydrolase [Halioglobus sp.]